MKEDRRVRKTKNALKDSLAKLLLVKPLKNITVREIAEMADINRGTFYLHYKDVYDMVDQIQNEIFNRFNEIITAYSPEDEKESLVPLLVNVFELLRENADLTISLIGEHGDAEFVQKIKELMRNRCFSKMIEQLDIDNNVKFEYFYSFMESGCIGVLEVWLKSGMKESPDDIADMVEKFILNGIQVIS